MRRALSVRLELLPATRGLLCIRTLALWSASLLHLLLHWSPTGRALLSLLSDCGARSTLLWFLLTLLLCIGRDRSCEYRQGDGGWDSSIHGVASYGFIPRSWAYNGRQQIILQTRDGFCSDKYFGVYCCPDSSVFSMKKGEYRLFFTGWMLAARSHSLGRPAHRCQSPPVRIPCDIGRMVR